MAKKATEVGDFFFQVCTSKDEYTLGRRTFMIESLVYHYVLGVYENYDTWGVKASIVKVSDSSIREAELSGIVLEYDFYINQLKTVAKVRRPKYFVTLDFLMEKNNKGGSDEL